MLATWPEKVERLISIDCRSPMSASTWSKTGSAAVSAGGRSPAWCSSAASPSVFSATVLPPVFGPLITSARRPPRSRSIGTAASGSSSGWRARREPHLVRDLDGRALPAARERPERERQVDSSRRLDGRGQQRGGFADGGRQLAQDPLDLLALGARRLGLAVRELDDVERLDEERLARVGGVVDDPGHAAAGARLDGEHGAAAAQGDEVLLQVLAQVARADELLELVADALAAGAELAAELAQLRGRVVAQVGAVLLDGAVDRLRDRRQRGVDRRRQLAEERRRRLVERPARPQRPRRRVGDVPERLRRERTAERGVRRLLADVADAVERRLERLVQERDRLGRQRLPPRHLVGVGRRLELRGERRAELGRGRTRDPLPDRGKLQHVERIRVHARV